MTKELALNFPHQRIVLRPHPSESLVFYQQAFASFPTVAVTRDDSVLPWIRAAELVVHSNCTTGIEAVLADRPVLNLLPDCDGRTELDVEVAREAGHVVGSIDEAVARAGELLSGLKASYDWSNHAKRMLKNLTERAVPRVADETMRVLQEQGITASKLVLPKETKVRDAVRRLIKGPTANYATSKRGPMKIEEVEPIVDGYRQKFGSGGRIRHMTTKYVVIDPA